MLSAALKSNLASYGVGDKLRALRLKRKLGLVQLSTHTGLSPAMLSKLERGRLFPTLPTLLRIALVFDVGLDHFFEASTPRRSLGIVRASDTSAFATTWNGPSGDTPRAATHAMGMLSRTPKAAPTSAIWK